MSHKKLFKTQIALTAALVVLIGTVATAQAGDDDWPPKVTSDGLDLVEGTKAASAMGMQIICNAGVIMRLISPR